MNATLPAPVCAIQYRIAEQNEQAIRQHLAAELRRTDSWSDQCRPTTNWRGIYVKWDEFTGETTGEVGGVLDFVAEWGLPVTHARATQIVRDHISTADRELSDRMDDGYRAWLADEERRCP